MKKATLFLISAALATQFAVASDEIGSVQKALSAVDIDSTCNLAVRVEGRNTSSNDSGDCGGSTYSQEAIVDIQALNYAKNNEYILRIQFIDKERKVVAYEESAYGFSDWDGRLHIVDDYSGLYFQETSSGLQAIVEIAPGTYTLNFEVYNINDPDFEDLACSKQETFVVNRAQ